MSEKIKAELMAIHAASKDGMLHAEAVVMWARSHRKSVLHRQFQWNDSKAATEYRLIQARQMIQLNIVTENGQPQLVSLTSDRTRGGGYRMVDDVAKDRTLSEVMFQDALRELTRVQARFAHIRKLSSVWKELERVRGVATPKQTRQLKKAA